MKQKQPLDHTGLPKKTAYIATIFWIGVILIIAVIFQEKSVPAPAPTQSVAGVAPDNSDALPAPGTASSTPAADPVSQSTNPIEQTYTNPFQ